MLETLRNTASHWTAKFLIGLLALSFVAWGIGDMLVRGSPNDEILASVGKKKISQGLYEQKLAQFKAELAQDNGQTLTQEQIRAQSIDQSLLNQLMQGAALDDLSARLQLTVSDETLLADLQKNPIFRNAEGNFDTEAFRLALERSGMSEKVFFSQSRQEHLRKAILEAASTAPIVSNTILQAVQHFQDEQRDSRYFTLTVKENEVTAPDDQEIKRYYQEHKQSYTAPEYRAIATIKVEPSDLAKKINLSEEEIKIGFDKYKEAYSQTETRTVLQLTFPNIEEAIKAKGRLDSGENFLDLAKERNLDESAITLADKRKGDFLDPTLAEAIFSLGENAVSAPVSGSLSTSLIKIIKINPAHIPTLAEVRSKLEEQLKLDKARDEVQNIYDLVEDARAGQAKFEDIAKRTDLPFQMYDAVDAKGLDRNNQPVFIPHKDQLVQAAFSSGLGIENDALSTDDGYIWYEVREIFPPALRPFVTINDKIKADLINLRQSELLTMKAKQLIEALERGADFKLLAEQQAAEIKAVQGLKRYETSNEFEQSSVNAIFSIPVNGFTWAADKNGKTAKIIQTTNSLLPKFDEKLVQAGPIHKLLRQGMETDLATTYLSALQKLEGFSINEALWQRLRNNDGTQ